MSARWIGAEVFADGIREFAARVAAEVTQPDELMYLLNFPDSGYDVLIGIEGFGMIMSWAVCCGDAPRSEDGIREFAARVAAEVTQPDELMYLLNFPDSG